MKSCSCVRFLGGHPEALLLIEVEKLKVYIIMFRSTLTFILKTNTLSKWEDDPSEELGEDILSFAKRETS